MAGAVVWTVFYVRGYMKRTEGRMHDMYKLSLENREEATKQNALLMKALTEAAEGIKALATAQKINMGVQVLSGLLPTVVEHLSGGNSEKAPARARARK